MEPFDVAVIEAVAGVLGDTNEGLTNGEIQRILAHLAVDDPRLAAEAQAPPGHYVSLNKRNRISAALIDHQSASGTGDGVKRFVEAAMSPVSYVSRHDLHAVRLGRLNEVLAAAGVEIRSDGRMARVPGGAATTIDEMAAKAGLLTTELKRRRCHPQVIRYCRAELLRKSNFHAASEAVKGVFDRLRLESGSTLDGAELVDEIFSYRNVIPVLALSRLSTKTEKSEQTGFMSLLKGLYGMYRNPLAHETRLSRDESRRSQTMSSSRC